MCLFKGYIILCSLLRVMIDRVIVCACEIVSALERRHSFAVGCVGMRKAFSAMESETPSNNNFLCY